jgi:hypothetical protein
LSGCTVLFFYDSEMRPSTFHILCGNEAADAESAARKAKLAMADANGVKILASNADYLETAKAGIAAANTGVTILKPEIYDTEPEDMPKGHKVTLTAHTGTYDVDQGNAPGCSRQPQGF